MKRVVVIGSGGAGKSTFSRKLSEATGIEVIHLDGLYWKPNWQKTPAEEWERTVAGLVKRESWIMDGNFGGTREMRIRAADTVIFMDPPRRVCMYRVLKRAIKYRGKTARTWLKAATRNLIWNFRLGLELSQTVTKTIFRRDVRFP